MSPLNLEVKKTLRRKKSLTFKLEYPSSYRFRKHQGTHFRGTFQSFSQGQRSLEDKSWCIPNLTSIKVKELARPIERKVKSVTHKTKINGRYSFDSKG